MPIYNFEASGRVKIEEPESGPRETKPLKMKEKLLEKALEYKFEIIWWAIYLLILILALILPESDFLEFLYLFHKKTIYSIGVFFILWETIYSIQSRVRKKPFGETINHILMSLFIFCILFGLNLWVYKMVIGPKLTIIEILEPKDGSRVSGDNIEVKVFVRNIELPVYPILETPQHTQWVQAKRFIQHNKFKDTLTLQVYLGGGYIGIGEIFKIFAIGTKEGLEIGTMLERIPPGAIHSNTVTVRRVR
jgi:hypothetical protein